MTMRAPSASNSIACPISQLNGLACSAASASTSRGPPPTFITKEPTAAMTAHPNFADLDRHLFRVAHGTLLDFPLAPEPSANVWTATLWPDVRNAGSWGRGLWLDGPNRRGWNLDPLVHLGDVIEFGADTAASPCRWYGYVVHADDVSLTLVGPFDSPNDAADDGRDSLPTWQTAHARTLACGCGGASPTAPD
jgi:hypothetical protein